jgi:hypothetical protein
MNHAALPQGDALERFDLNPGEMYRISYAVGTHQQRRVTRSLVVYEGSTDRRMWGGQQVRCLDFSRPQGRPLSLLATQLVDARPATLNDRGQLVLTDEPGQRRRRVSRRNLIEQPAW